MKYYMRFLWVAVLCGIFVIFGHTRNNTENSTVLFSNIILILGFFNVEYIPPYISIFTNIYIPLLLFQLFYGTYIYRHFCSASIYFFSRQCNRTTWFLKETAQLYLFCIAYIVLLILSGTVVTTLLIPVTITKTSIFMAIYYILISSFFLLSTTLAINMLSILFTSSVGFIIVESFLAFYIGFFMLMGKYFIVDDSLIESYTWLLKINPIAHLVWNVHSSKITAIDQMINIRGISFDLNSSIFFFFICSILFIMIGCVVINHHNFIESNKETGGF